ANVGFSWVGQRGTADCGAAALAMAARRLGRRVALEEVLKLLAIDERGADLKSLAHAAAALGLPARGFQLSAERLAAVPLPAVALLTAEHYVVVYSLGPHTVEIGDPARGVLALDRAEFLRQWSGHVLLFGPVAAAPADNLDADEALITVCRKAIME